eukprot:3134205-Amphidinium_carterae.2
MTINHTLLVPHTPSNQDWKRTGSRSNIEEVVALLSTQVARLFVLNGVRTDCGQLNRLALRAVRLDSPCKQLGDEDVVVQIAAVKAGQIEHLSREVGKPYSESNPSTVESKSGFSTPIVSIA